MTRTPPESITAETRSAYERGQVLDSLEIAIKFAPLEEWEGIVNQCLAARIAMSAGGTRLSAKLAARMWRSDASHPLAQFEYGIQLLHRRGPVAFWILAAGWNINEDANPGWLADLFALKARAASELRDFTTAHELIRRACELDPKAPWVQLQRAYVAEKEERLEEALEIATAACRLHPHPFYRSGVQTVADLLQSMGRDAEGIELLRQADAGLQSCLVASQLFGLRFNTEQWTEAGMALDRYESLAALIEPAGKTWLRSTRAHLAHIQGNRARALEFARALDDPFNREFARKLESPAPEGERIHLSVPFVRQNFKTCAPATLAAIGRYWRIPAEHLSLAEAICYDGTPSWQQREWAESNGYIVREFRVTWECACALIDRTIPFAVATVETTSSHLQAVMGIDRTRGTLLLREPSQPYSLEVDAVKFLERYRPFGPHGMVFLPRDHGARLAEIQLPDTGLYDEAHRLRLALSKHDRAGATAALDRLESLSTDHEITWEARLDLATYDTNSREQIRCLDRLLELFPGNPTHLHRRFGCMREMSREEQIEFLNHACAGKAADPIFFVELARNLVVDARQLDAAERCLERALRQRASDSRILTALADLRWSTGRFPEATELYYFAATSEGYREALYQTWFAACRQVRQLPAAQRHLEDRCQRLKTQSSQPALTLAWALRQLDQPENARAVLEAALRERSDDGYVALRAASLESSLGNAQRADELLQLAKGKVRESDWLRSSAEIAEARDAFHEVLGLARSILQLEPLALDAHGAVARALAKLEGPDAAVESLKAACALHPRHIGLSRLHVEWASKSGAGAVESAARATLALSPGDAWTLRELASALTKQRRFEEALVAAQAAREIEPLSTAGATILGHAYEGLKQPADARSAFHKAITLSVDNTHAIFALLRLASSDAERKSELAMIQHELVRQVVRGDGLLAFLDVARPLLPGDALLAVLRRAHADRPDLWHAWSALTMQLDHLDRAGEALPLARQATERFPHLPRLWLDSAVLHRHRGEFDAEIADATRAFEINPAWNRSAIMLAGALERHRSLDDAENVYLRALNHSPNDPQLLVQFASVLWRRRKSSEALLRVQQAIRENPEADAAWNLLINWSRESGQPDLPVDFARKLTVERPGDGHTWLIFARVLGGTRHLPERLAAIDQARTLNPGALEPFDFKAELLAGASQFDAAMQTCDEGINAGVANSFALKGRRAWIDARRERVSEAIVAMRAVLAENSGYIWGWQQLTAWLTQEARYGEARDAIDQLLALQPHNLSAKRQAADIRLRTGDRRAAEKILLSVFEAAPTDPYSADQLFNLQLEVGNLQGASATVKRLQVHQPGARTLARQVILDTRSSQEPEALETFKALCCLPDVDPWPVQAATDALVKSQLTRGALEILEESAAMEVCNPQVGATAVNLLLQKGQTNRAIKLLDGIQYPEAQVRTAVALIHELGRNKASHALRKLIHRHRPMLQGNDSTWTEVGYSLTNIGRMGEAAEWMSDWRSRANVPASVYFNYCYALRNEGRFDEAFEVAQYAVSQPGYRGDTSADLRLFLAIDHALAGSLEPARAELRLVRVRKNAAFDERLRALARSLVEFQSSPQESRRHQFREIHPRLAKLFPTSKMPGIGSDLRVTFRRAGEVFCQNGAGAGAQFWFFWRLYWPWSLTPLGLALVSIPFFCHIEPTGYSGIFGGLASVVFVWLLRMKKR